MYLKRFKLDDFPFRLAPDLEYVYTSRGFSQAKAYVDYSLLSRDGFVVITGEIGSGKTTLMRQLLADMPGETVVVHIEQTQLSPVELLQAVAMDLLGEVETASKVELTRRIRECLNQAYAQDLRIVIAIDEAQNLSFQVLEELRMLAGIESHRERVISVILMGQPQLESMLDSPAMEQLRQRVRLRFHLEGLSPDEIQAYVRHRLAVAGIAKPDALFRPAVYPIIERYTGGIPRLINTLCDMALLTAYVDDKARVDEAVMTEAITELGWSTYEERIRHARAAEEREAPVEGAAVPVPLARGSIAVERALERIEKQLTRIADALEREEGAVQRRGVS